MVPSRVRGALKSLSVATRALLIASLLFLPATAPAYAAEGTWSSSHPYWCYRPAESCGLWSSDTQYVGPTYVDCYALITDGWASYTMVTLMCGMNETI